jgi:cytochrome P450
VAREGAAQEQVAVVVVLDETYSPRPGRTGRPIARSDERLAGCAPALKPDQSKIEIHPAELTACRRVASAGSAMGACLPMRQDSHVTATATGASELPPGPPLPRLVQTLGFVFAPARFLDACRRRYGDVVTFGTLFDERFVIVFEPEAVKQVFRGSADRLHAGEANAVLGPVVGARSVLLLDGAEHLRQRRLMLPSFHGERMRTYEDVMVAATDRAIGGWPVGRPFSLLASMRSLTLDVIVRAVFGVEEGPRERELKRRLRELVDPVGTRLSVAMMVLTAGRVGIAGRSRAFEQRRRAVDELIYDEITRRRDAPDLDEREDVFSMLLLTRDEDDQRMSDQELRDELVTLLVAGHETTATGLAWALELLLRNPRVLERLRGALADGDDAYLEAVVKEALRVRPVISGIGRVVRETPFEVGGYLIPPGVEINPSIGAIHRRPDRYPQPGEFRPERFLGADAPDTYTWLPFGGGVRRCLGASFATFEMKVVIRRVLERAQLQAVGRRPETAVRKGVTFVPKRGARVMLVESPRPALADAGPTRVAATERRAGRS